MLAVGATGGFAGATASGSSAGQLVRRATRPRPALLGARHIAPSVTWPAPTWAIQLAGSVTQSSPTVATVAGRTIVAVGDEDGFVHVVDARTGIELPGWPAHVAAPRGASAPIESSPTIAYLDGPHRPPTIIVGTGSTWVKGDVGEVEAFTLGGRPRFVFRVGTAGHGTAVGVISSPAVGDLTGGGQQDIVFGSWDHNIYALSPSGRVLPGFPFNNADTIWSSPALYHLPGTLGETIFLGSDASGLAVVQNGARVHCFGGFVGAYRYTGAAVTPRWRDCEPQPVWSSPAVGILTSASHPVVVVGTSFYEQPFPSETDRLFAFDARSGRLVPGWPVHTAGPVLGSPAIGEIAPHLRGVVDTSWNCSGPVPADCYSAGSKVYAFDAAGHQLWSDTVPGSTTWGSPVLIPLEGHLSNDVLVGSPNALYPLEGATGAFLFGTNGSNQFAGIDPGCRMFNAPAVADVAGTGPGSGWHVFEACGGPPVFQVHGTLTSYALPVAPPIAPGWPMFHDNAAHDGAALAPGLSLLAPPAAVAPLRKNPVRRGS